MTITEIRARTDIPQRVKDEVVRLAERIELLKRDAKRIEIELGYTDQNTHVRYDGITDELLVLMAANRIPNIETDENVLTERMSPSREWIDKLSLIDQGVDLAIIKKATRHTRETLYLECRRRSEKSKLERR